MIDVIETLISGIFSKIISLCQYAFNYIFGDWPYQQIFFWLPSDISSYLASVILIIFAVALIRFIANLIP